jgi:2-keto-3-deoxy-L-rhamnonate aldolase RhmA
VPIAKVDRHWKGVNVVESRTQNADVLRAKLRSKRICIGAAITFADATVTEALCNYLDFIWVDMEHIPFSLETVQAHMMATKGSETVPFVRVAWNDPVLIKPVLDMGAAGVIAPMVCSAEEAARLVTACLYPPQGIRGFGPRRPANYGLSMTPKFCLEANASVFPIAQIEHITAVDNIDAILSTPGLTAIMIGPFDLSGSMGYPAEPHHPKVLEAIDHVIARAKKADIFVGMGVTDNPESVKKWIDKGVSLIFIPPDYMLMLQATRQFIQVIRNQGEANAG